MSMTSVDKQTLVAVLSAAGCGYLKPYEIDMIVMEFE